MTNKEAIKKLKSFKFRPSAVGRIMTNLESITEKQLERITYLEGRPKMTDKQAEEHATLIAKRDAPDELPSGAKTYLKDLYNTIIYDISEDVRTDALDKGNLCEQDSLDLISRLSGVFLIKNEQTFSNSYITGTPDSFQGSTVIDAKSNWDKHSFDKVEGMADIYEWQLRAYMWLTRKPFAMLAHCLVDTPQEIIDDAIRRAMYREGILDEMSEEGQALSDQITLNMTFSRIPENTRLKTFYVEHDQEMIEHMKRRIRMSRQWMVDYHKQLTKAKPVILFRKPRKDKK